LAAISAFVRRNAVVAATGVIALVVFGCSLRTVEFDPLTVAISEHWAGFTGVLGAAGRVERTRLLLCS
jgi:hypothetical protein